MKKLLFALCIISLTAIGAETCFLSQKKNAEPKQEWNRELDCKHEGYMRFKIKSQGSFSVTLVTDAFRKALIERDREAMKANRKGFLFSKDITENEYDHSIQLNPGHYWIIIRNNMTNSAELSLECFNVDEPASKNSEAKTNSVP